MPTDFGTRLRQARERRGLSLRQIATATKINVSALEGIEANDPSKLPGGIFSRAFVKAYAQEVGLDPEATVREYLATFSDDVEIPVAEPTPAFEPAPAGMGRAIGPWVAAAVLIGAAVLGMRFLGWPGSRTAAPAEASPAAIAPLPVQEAPAAGPTTPSDSSVAPSDAPPMSAPDSGATVASAPAVPDEAVPPGVMRLTLHPKDGSCWAQVSADGTLVLSRELQAGESETRTASKSFDLTVGNAGYCAFSINGKPGRPLGPVGKVVKLRIDQASIPGLLGGSPQP